MDQTDGLAVDRTDEMAVDQTDESTVDNETDETTVDNQTDEMAVDNETDEPAVDQTDEMAEDNPKENSGSPRVSVVIPTYNRADVLPRAIDSVLTQTFEAFELLVVDDGSTDRTETVVASLDDSRVRYVAHETNRGANVARNTGIEHARGEYVAFLDSDDAWHPTKLEKQLGRLEKRPSDWVAAYCGFTIETTGVTGTLQTLIAGILAHSDDPPPMEGGEELIGAILADEIHPGAGSTLLVRTAVAREVGGFDEPLDRFQDPEFVIRILRAGAIVYVDEPLVVRHETGSPDAEVIRDASEQYLSTYADTVDRLEAEGYEIRASHDFVIAKAFYTEGRYLRGTWHLAHATVVPRHYPGLLWAIGTGVRRRPAPVVAGVVLVALLAVLGAARRQT